MTVFTKKTPMEIRFATHEGPRAPSPIEANPEQSPSEESSLAKLAMPSLAASPP
jgi:hypothetical protein